MIWATEWPEAPGWYWFYGWAHKCQYASPPDLAMVRVRRVGTLGLVYIWHGAFLYKHEGARGVWCVASPPTVPERSELDIALNQA